MTERAVPAARPAARRRALVQTVSMVAAAAVAATALVWSALFYSATRKHAVTTASPPAAQVAPAGARGLPAPTVEPLTTRTS
jgi:hypothetical protein